MENRRIPSSGSLGVRDGLVYRDRGSRQPILSRPASVSSRGRMQQPCLTQQPCQPPLEAYLYQPSPHQQLHSGPSPWDQTQYDLRRSPTPPQSFTSANRRDLQFRPDENLRSVGSIRARGPYSTQANSFNVCGTNSGRGIVGDLGDMKIDPQWQYTQLNRSVNANSDDQEDYGSASDSGVLGQCDQKSLRMDHGGDRLAKGDRYPTPPLGPHSPSLTSSRYSKRSILHPHTPRLAIPSIPSRETAPPSDVEQLLKQGMFRSHYYGLRLSKVYYGKLTNRQFAVYKAREGKPGTLKAQIPLKSMRMDEADVGFGWWKSSAIILERNDHLPVWKGRNYIMVSGLTPYEHVGWTAAFQRAGIRPRKKREDETTAI